MDKLKMYVPLDRQQLNLHKDYWTDVLDRYREVGCDSAERESWWGQVLESAQGHIKLLDATRTAHVQPLNDEVRQVNAAYKEVLAPAEALKALAKEKLASAAQARLDAETTARAAAQLAARAGDSNAVYAALATVPDAVRVDGARTSSKWVAEVVDASLVPDAFKVVDVAKLNAYAKTMGEAAQVPGVVFKQVATVAAKGKRHE